MMRKAKKEKAEAFLVIGAWIRQMNPKGNTINAASVSIFEISK